MSYTIGREVEGGFDETVGDVQNALAEAGFGVLCDIDVAATFEEKLGESFRRYRILGACNPPLAHEALHEEVELGALLPCNVIVYETDAGTVGVKAVDPTRLLSLVDEPALDAVAAEVRDRFERVLDAVAAPAA